MRKVLLTLAVLLFCSTAFLSAQVTEINYRDEATLEWNAVTTASDGSALLPTDVVTYEVFVYDYYGPAIDDQLDANLVLVGTPVSTSQVIDFAGFARTAYTAGVRAVVTDGQGGVTRGPIAWSYDPVATNPTGPFLYIPLAGVLVLPLPTGLRDVGM